MPDVRIAVEVGDLADVAERRSVDDAITLALRRAQPRVERAVNRALRRAAPVRTGRLRRSIRFRAALSRRGLSIEVGGVFYTAASSARGRRAGWVSRGYSQARPAIVNIIRSAVMTEIQAIGR